MFDEQERAHLLKEIKQIEEQLGDMLMGPPGDIADCLSNAYDELIEARRLLEEPTDA